MSFKSLSFAFGLSAVMTLVSSADLTPASAQEHGASGHQSYEKVIDGESSYVFLFAFPSAAYLDWSSPSKLTWTSLQSTIAQRAFGLPTTIGHAQFAWHCQRPDGQVLSSGASGQSGERHGQSLQVLKGGWGMSLLELVYTDGILESTQQVKDRIHKGAAKDQFSWTAFQVPTSSCLAMAEYVDRFREAGAHRNYGFPVDPLKLEGGGCTSFAHAAVVNADLPLPFQEDWLRQYNIARQDMGRSETLPDFTAVVPQAKVPAEPQYVGLPEFLWGNKTWARPGEPSAPFRYYDPELFYESFLHLENAYRAQQQLPLRQALRTSTMDNYQQTLKTRVNEWMGQLQNQGVPMHLSQIEDKSGLVIDLRPLMDSE